MFGPLWIAAALSCAAPLPVPPRAEDASQPKLIAKGKDFFVHVLRPNPASFRLTAEPPGWPDSRTVTDGLIVLHTSAATGEMKVLAAGQNTVRPSPPMGIDRLYYNRTRVAGIAADEERLYVLLWRSSTEVMVGVDKGPVRPQNAGYQLLVFRPDNGVPVHTLDLKEGDFPKDQPPEAADRGPLQLRGDGLTCFGVIFEFKGTQLLQQHYEGKKP